MRNKKVFIYVSFFAGVAFLAGCTTTSERRYSDPANYNYDSKRAAKIVAPMVASILRFDDVPVPAGFKILESESFAFQNDSTRVVLLKYVGTGNTDLIVAFFKEQMPMYNWSPINVIEYEKRILNYEKTVENCIVTIESQGKRNIITIAISPKSKPMKGSAKKDE